MLDWIIILGVPGLVIAALIKVSDVNWHFQGLLLLTLCLFLFGVSVRFGPAWFGI